MHTHTHTHTHTYVNLYVLDKRDIRTVFNRVRVDYFRRNYTSILSGGSLIIRPRALLNTYEVSRDSIDKMPYRKIITLREGHASVCVRVLARKMETFFDFLAENDAIYRSVRQRYCRNAQYARNEKNDENISTRCR